MLDMFGNTNFSRFRDLPTHFDWTDERVEELRKMYAAGHSYSVIADKLGTTRNSVGGKIDRLGLGGNRKTVQRTYPTTRRRRERVDRVVRFSNSQPVSVDLVQYEKLPLTSEFLCIPLLDLEHGMCRFPRGEGLDTVFCGVRPVQPGSAYCTAHHRLCYDKPSTERSTRGAQLRDLGRRYSEALRDASL